MTGPPTVPIRASMWGISPQANEYKVLQEAIGTARDNLQLRWTAPEDAEILLVAPNAVPLPDFPGPPVTMSVPIDALHFDQRATLDDDLGSAEKMDREAKRIQELLRMIAFRFWDAAAKLRPSAPPVTVPTGPERLRVAYLVALDRPDLFEVLTTLDETTLRDALARTPLEELERKYPGAVPNPLWAAWMETVSPDKLRTAATGAAS